MPAFWVKFFFWSYLLFFVCAAATVTNSADPDLWHRLATGEFLWDARYYPPGDVFSYLSDYSRPADAEWGSALIFYGLWQLGQGAAIVLIKIVALAITLTLLVSAGLRDRKPTVLITAFYVLVILALLPSFQSTARCMIFTHIFFALWLYLLQRERHGKKVPTLFYVLTTILWTNLHGGFVIGLVWLLVVTVTEMLYRGPWRKWSVRLGLCTLATLINPFGWRLWAATWRAVLVPRNGFSEWAPVSWFSHPLFYPGYKLLLGCVVAVLAFTIYRRSWKRVDQPSIILIGLALALSLSSAQYTSLFAVVVGALLPPLYPRAEPLIRMRNPLRVLVTMLVNCAIIIVPLYSVLVVPSAGLTLEYPYPSCPEQAIDYLQRQNIRGNLLVPFNYGSYALWELRGKMRVSMDGRYDLVYRPETYRRVSDFFADRGDWKALLANPTPDAILVPRSDEVYAKLREEPGWKEAWHDSWDAVFLPR